MAFNVFSCIYEMDITYTITPLYNAEYPALISINEIKDTIRGLQIMNNRTITHQGLKFDVFISKRVANTLGKNRVGIEWRNNETNTGIIP